MAEQTVIGLFYTSGGAQDVANRLKYEGVPAADIALRQLHETSPLPPTMVAEAQGYAADPFWGSLILKKFGDRIGDGETAVCVRARDADTARVAVGTMRQYVPVAIELVAPDEVEAFLAEEQAKPAR
jgi:hypothetical protein